MLDCSKQPDAMSIPNKTSHQVGVVLVPGFTMTSLAVILDPFQQVNKIIGHELFDCQLISLDGCKVTTSFGVDIECGLTARQYQEDLYFLKKPDVLYLCCGTRISGEDQKKLDQFLRNIRRYSIPIIGLGAAVWSLVDVGYLKKGKCAIHWQSRISFSEETHNFEIENTLFEKNGLVTTCPGELATFDLTISQIDEICGFKVADQICCNLISSNRRSRDTTQLVNADVIFCDNEEFRKTVTLMQENIEAPLKTHEISQAIGITERQIQRVFAKIVSTSPSKYYRNLRLDKAKQLLEQTQMSYIEVSIACGFNARSTFSRQYKERFERSPSKAKQAFLEFSKLTNPIN